MTARPASLGYRAKKVIAKHRLAAAAGAIVTAVVLGGLALSVSLYLRAANAREQAEQQAYVATIAAAAAQIVAADTAGPRGRPDVSFSGLRAKGSTLGIGTRTFLSGLGLASVGFSRCRLTDRIC